jgi:membrane fusion protein
VALERQHIDAYGQPQPLKAGLTLDADVMQDRRRIVEWMLEPAIAVMRRTEG